MPKKSKSKPAAAAGSARVAGLQASARNGDLVVVIGTGVSVALTGNKVPAMNWRGLVESGFAYGVSKGKITRDQAAGWKAQLQSSDLDELLTAAEFMSRKLQDLYPRWLSQTFEAVTPASESMRNALVTLQHAGIPLATLNYDTLVERVTNLPSINLSETTKVTQWMRRTLAGVLHLHGSWEAPETCILTIRDYDTTLGNEKRDLVQRSLGSFRRLLFIGCGDTFADPNFTALIAWLKKHIGSAALEHYALVVNGEVETRDADPAWHGFVEPIGYGEKHDALPQFLIDTFGALADATPKKKTAAKKASDPASHHETLLREYRAFLVKDCGQMTIEGVRADMETGGRRFNLERLFVPVTVLPSPPEISATDVDREQKLVAWQEKNKDPLPFGEIFSKNKRLALLALPGGGKTLLLKRLAVAYADPARRQASLDGLPDLDLTPVLIRCREWREHIHRPILTLLNNIPDITGQASLAGLSEALIPLFKEGRALLLVDGLDEIHDDALRTTFVEHLERFLDDYKKTRVVVTSREAGFTLVAPTLARFCGRWRLAPLDEAAITALCQHWHRLMIDDSPSTTEEAASVAETLLRNESLRRLAENPLLLTMLLVVKHGAGRLPPDRVSLYDRAVEVLLDTWNIKGHERLNPKEAVPQLAYVAFKLLRAGKQTATETELLDLLAEARENVPHIRRYAQDTPQRFLQRVELRSSLVVEIGWQKEGAGTVPLYQFRHLTFQEYLAAVAAVEGHYDGYDKADTILTPLKDYLLAEEWKEVVPMSAVLAGKQGEPLINALVEEGETLDEVAFVDSYETWPPKLPAPISRLVQCLIEEAEAAPETLTKALRLIAVSARGAQSRDDWPALVRGPYGDELRHQAWLLYTADRPRDHHRLLRTSAAFAFLQRPEDHWFSNEGREELGRMLRSDDPRMIGTALLTLCGSTRIPGDGFLLHDDDLPLMEQNIFRDEHYLYEPAVWAWTSWRRGLITRPAASPRVLDRLLSLWLLEPMEEDSIGSYALRVQYGLPRNAWKPVLTGDQRQVVRRVHDDSYDAPTACVVAFHDGNVWPEEEVATRLVAAADDYAPVRERDGIISMLRELEIAPELMKSLIAKVQR